MQAVRKARKNNSPRMKRHTFLQKQGNIQKDKNRPDEKKRKKREEKCRKWRRSKAPNIRNRSDNDKIFQFVPFKPDPETKKERMEQEEQHPPTERLFPTIPFFNGKKEPNPTLLHFSQAGALFWNLLSHQLDLLKRIPQNRDKISTLHTPWCFNPNDKANKKNA